MDILMPVILLVGLGFLATGTLGLLATWVDRKVTARVQYRVGPPWYQPLADIIKLLGKENMMPATARRTGFLLAPVIALSATGVDPYTSFTLDFNYGFCKYDDIGNHDFHINTFECVGVGNANDSDFNIELLHHLPTGWAYHATAFIPGNGAVCDLQTDHVTEYELVAGEPFAYKRTDLHAHCEGLTGAEGFVIRVTTGTNNSLEYVNCHIGYH